MTSSDLIGTAEAAALLGWSIHKVKRTAKAGTLPTALKMDGRTGAYLFHRAVIEHIATSQEVAA